MAFARTEYTGNGATTTYAIGFTFLRTAYLRVFVEGVEQDVTIDWNLDGAETNVVFVAAVANGDEILIYRDTSRTTRIVDWEGGARITEADLDDSDSQLFHIMQELDDGGGGAALESALDAAEAATEAAASAVAAAASAALYLGMGTLDSLTDVNTAGVVNGDALVYNGGVWGPGEPAVLELGDLTDVTITAPSTNDVLAYNGAEWAKQTPVIPPHDWKTSTSNTAATVTTDTECTVVIPATGTWRIEIDAVLHARVSLLNAGNAFSEMVCRLEQKIGAAAYVNDVASGLFGYQNDNQFGNAYLYGQAVVTHELNAGVTNGETFKYKITPLANNSAILLAAGSKLHSLRVNVVRVAW